MKSSSLSDYSNQRNCPHLSADISSFLRSQFFQPISLHFVKVTLDSRLQGFILPDGCQAEGGTCELTWHYHLCDITLQSSGVAAYPHSKDERSHKATEGIRGIGGNMVFQLGCCGKPVGGSGLRGLRAAATKVFIYLPGFWFPVSSPEATLLLKNARTPAGKKKRTCSIQITLFVPQRTIQFLLSTYQ